MYECFACMSPTCVPDPHVGQKKTSEYRRLWAATAVGGWEGNPGLLQEQLACSTAEPSPQPLGPEHL